MKEWVKRQLKQSIVGRRIYPFCHSAYRVYSVPHRRRLIKRHGYTTLDKVNRAMSLAGIPYFVDYGTLLGVIREKGFIPNDFDIDIALPPTSHTLFDVYQVLKQEGFIFNRAFEYDNKVVCMNVLYCGVPVDFFKYFPGDANGTMFCYSFYWDERRTYNSANENSARCATLPLVDSCLVHQVHGIFTRVPANFELVLKSEYGEGWRIPDSNWVEEDQPNLKECSSKGIAIDLSRVQLLSTAEKSEGGA